MDSWNLHMLIKQKSPSLPRTFFSATVKLLFFLHLTAWRCCLLHLIKQNCLLKTFPGKFSWKLFQTFNSNLNNSGISLPVFPSRTNLKLRNISVTLKIVKKILINLDLLKAAGPYCIPLVVLKNFVPEGLMAPVYKNIGGKV